MKLMHLSDLHIGKHLIDASLLEDQRYIFDRILDLMDEENPDAVLIAGDVYDRSAPSAEATALLDELLKKLAARGKPVLIISGNHDSPERLVFASSFMAQSRIHIAPVYGGHIEPVTLTDAHGPVRFWLMPYVQPETVARFFEGRTVRSANDAVAAVIGEMSVDPAERNVIVSHQFIAGGVTSDSERRNIGTLEDVDASLYNAFDYVALGHLHRSQITGREDGTMRYSGTPLVYSRSEIGAPKTVTFAELGPKGSVTVRERALAPLRETRAVRGLFDDLMRDGPAEGTEKDYYFIDLTDEDDIPNAIARLRERFPYLQSMRYDNKRTRELGAVDAPEAVEEKEPLELMRELYALTHGGEEMSDEAVAFFLETMKKLGGFQA